MKTLVGPQGELLGPFDPMLRAPAALAISRVTCAAILATKRRRWSLDRSPGCSVPGAPISPVILSSRAVVARIHPGIAAVSLIAGRGK